MQGAITVKMRAKAVRRANSNVCIANVNTVIRHLKQHVTVKRKEINKGCADTLKSG